jgi:tetratricopeptide (TPR) repeat protein
MIQKSPLRFGHQPEKPQADASPKRLSELSLAFSRAQALHQAGRLPEAEEIYRQILRSEAHHWDSQLHLGIIHHQRGDYNEALHQIDAALKINPTSALAHRIRGNALQKLKRLAEAVASYDQAISLAPDDASSFNSLGNALGELKRFDEALASYNEAIALKGDHAGAFYNRANVLHELQRFNEAVMSYHQAIRLKPDYADAFKNCGNTLQKLKRLEEAVESYDQAISLAPADGPAFYNRGVALHELKRFEEAVASYDRAVALMPDFAIGFCRRGDALRALNRLDEALASYEGALVIEPHYVEALGSRGNVLSELKRPQEALANYDRALAVRPDYVEALGNRANILAALKRFDEAFESFERTLALRPDYVLALSNYGFVLHTLHRFDEALASFARATAIRPDYADAHFNEAACRLLLGDFDRGWNKYEWRWEIEPQRSAKRNFAQPLWMGQDDIAGRTVLLHAEQGYGDTIQFCRYVHKVADRGAHVILEVPLPLQRLLSELQGPQIVVARGEPLPAFDYHCPILSLPLAFGTQLASIPPQAHLSVPPDLLQVWQRRLGPKAKPRVGIAWSGSAGQVNDHNRSMSLRALSPLLELPVEIISLQKDALDEDQDLLDARAGQVVHFGSALTDFLETAALISQMDLIISVDTAVAHLACSLGRATWIPLCFTPDWRWMLNREDSPWYPTARLFRQRRPGPWDEVIARIAGALSTMLSNLHNVTHRAV